jgi:PAS domain S-box-containing protein
VSAPPTIAGRSHVLVVDDNRDLCENLAEILGAQGYRVDVALSARAGAQSARAARPEVALIDLNLPDSSGMALLAELRAASPETECIILTGNASIETAVEAVNRGAYAYLIKGGRFEEVVGTVGRAAEKVRLEREKRLLEAALREERNFSRAIVSNAALGIAVVARSGEVLELNRRMAELLGGGPPPLRAAEIAALGRDDAARARLAAALAGEGGPRESLEIEARIAPGNGDRTWTVSTSLVAGGGDRPDAVVAVFADVTEERKLQRKLLDASRLAAIGEMAARVAHEIRNPLAGIAGAIRILGRGVEGEAKRDAFVRELLALVARLNMFVEDLLLYARPLKIAKEEVAIGVLVERLRTAQREHPLLRGVTIEVDDRLGRPIRVDPHFFGMALQNLVFNAAQAMKGRGRCVVAAAAEDERVIVSVADEGPGLSPEIIPQLFEAFSTTRIEGTGLGLSITRRIVEAHGGTVSARNGERGGARFEVRLPA